MINNTPLRFRSSNTINPQKKDGQNTNRSIDPFKPADIIGYFEEWQKNKKSEFSTFHMAEGILPKSAPAEPVYGIFNNFPALTAVEELSLIVPGQTVTEFVKAKATVILLKTHLPLQDRDSIIDTIFAAGSIKLCHERGLEGAIQSAYYQIMIAKIDAHLANHPVSGRAAIPERPGDIKELKGFPPANIGRYYPTPDGWGTGVYISKIAI